eukprot:TRINITY_DN20069_c0_g1_i2.p1 TRINITY_DN20069_c0_g1~~TRINITY_DN20069_c0_g1_i2.p1  ORF type:complete len:167 (-),score=13.04 TRINITY_DN20069_c0_g1_i2:249-749(-)
MSKNKAMPRVMELTEAHSARWKERVHQEERASAALQQRQRAFVASGDGFDALAQSSPRYGRHQKMLEQQMVENRNAFYPQPSAVPPDALDSHQQQYENTLPTPRRSGAYTPRSESGSRSARSISSRGSMYDERLSRLERIMEEERKGREDVHKELMAIKSLLQGRP